MPKPKYTREQIIKAMTDCSNIDDVLIQIGEEPSESSKRNFRKRCKTEGIDYTVLASAGTVRYSEEELRVAAAHSSTMPQLCAMLGASTNPGMQYHLSQRMKKLNITLKG